MPGDSRWNSILAVGAAAAFALGAGQAAADTPQILAAKKPVLLQSLTKEQIRALGDNDPIDVGAGKITTKAQVLADIRKLKPQADAWVAQKASAAAARFQKSGLELAAAQKARIESNNIKALAAVAALRQQIEQQKTDAKPTPCAGPHIASVSASSGGIYPGMAAFLAGGSCFSATQGNGRLRIEWISDGGSYHPPVTLWNDHLVMVTIPDSLAGLKEQDALVSVVRSDGTSSNKLTVHFVPLFETKTIFANDGALTPVCSMGADINDCDPVGGRTFDGVHANTIDISDDTGTDKVKVALKNGWVLKDKEWEVGNWLNGGGATLTFPVGQSSTDVTMHFFVRPIGYIRYYTIFLIEGPRGVAHK